MSWLGVVLRVREIGGVDVGMYLSRFLFFLFEIYGRTRTKKNVLLICWSGVDLVFWQSLNESINQSILSNDSTFYF